MGREFGGIKINSFLCIANQKDCTHHMGKCHTASSFRILQGLIAAKVVSCSGAMWRAFPPASLAQLARARDL